MSTEREQIIRAAVAAMPSTNPGVADDLLGGFTMHTEADDIIAIWNAARSQAPASQAPSSTQAEPVTSDKWECAEEWMPLAWELCANECGEEACTELIWEGGPIPEPWGDRWLKYEDQAKEMIAMVRKLVPSLAATPAAAPAPETQPDQDSSDPSISGDAREHSSGREVPAIGDYVLATKYSDGDPGDPWALGFYAGRETYPSSVRHMVRDNSGKNIRASGYRRVGRITEEFGHWLWKHRAELEASPPGTVNLWGMLGSRATPEDETGSGEEPK